MDIEKLVDEAKWVIIMFDQANTNKAIEVLGYRGQGLASAVNDLRKVMTDSGVDPYRTKDEGTWSIGWYGKAK